jgi:ABC-2 type transport system permease protein
VTALTAQVRPLARRSVARTMRQPAHVVPAILFPLILLAVNAGGLKPATALPGFPSESYLDFFLAFSFLQGATFATMNSGADLARDIQTGFLTRLSLTPMRGSALLAGHLGGAAAMGLAQSVVYLSVGLIAGVSIATGLAGVLLLLVLVVLITLGFGAWGAFLALRSGSGESLQGFFPLMFALLFLSSMYLPRNLIEADWFRAIATINPVSYLIEGIRSLIIVGWDAQALGLAFAFAFALLVSGLAASALALRTRLTRT